MQGQKEGEKEEGRDLGWWARWGLTILLAGGNLLYLWAFGWGPIQDHPQLILINLVLFLVVGLAVFLAASYYLHRWFILRKDGVHSQAK